MSSKKRKSCGNVTIDSGDLYLKDHIECLEPVKVTAENVDSLTFDLSIPTNESWLLLDPTSYLNVKAKIVKEKKEADIWVENETFEASDLNDLTFAQNFMRHKIKYIEVYRNQRPLKLNVGANNLNNLLETFILAHISERFKINNFGGLSDASSSRFTSYKKSDFEKDSDLQTQIRKSLFLSGGVNVSVYPILEFPFPCRFDELGELIPTILPYTEGGAKTTIRVITNTHDNNCFIQ